MFVSPTIFSSHATFIPVDDRHFFLYALTEAQRLYSTRSDLWEGMDTQTLKRGHIPAIYASAMTKQIRDELSMTRPELNRRALRGFIMLDIDTDAGEDEEADALYGRIVADAEERGVWTLIYPTPSFPEKTRFRAVQLIDRKMGAVGYAKGVAWWRKHVGADILSDAGDLRITSPRNAPFFTDPTQLGYVWHNLDDDDLHATPTTLWSKDPDPLKKSASTEPPQWTLPPAGYRLDMEDFYERLAQFATTPRARTREGTWQLLETFAREMIVGTFTPSQAKKACDILAHAADDERTRLAWASNNWTQVDAARRAMLRNQSRFAWARPIVLWEDFALAGVTA